MKVGELRQRVIQKAKDVAGKRDEELVARVMTYSRALLVALASYEEDVGVDLDTLTINTGTAAKILDMHTEYVRDLVRREELLAEKENGEFRIPFISLIDFMDKRQKAATRGHYFDDWRRFVLARMMQVWKRA